MAARFTAVVLGLAAQQTLGNLFAGTVLLSARPFRVGERVSLQGGGSRQVEGVVSSLGLLYTTFASGDDAIMVPNSVVLGAAVTPLHEPAGVDLRARLRPGVTPIDVQNLLQDTSTTPIRGEPRVTLEEIDGDEIVVRIAATPERAADGREARGRGPAAVAPETRRVETRSRLSALALVGLALGHARSAMRSPPSLFGTFDARSGATAASAVPSRSASGAT